MWMVGQFEWTYYEIYLHREVPDPFAGDIIFFLRGIPLIAALALRPHLKREELRMGLGYLDFALLPVVVDVCVCVFCVAVDVRQLLGRRLQLRVQRAEYAATIGGDYRVWRVLAAHAKRVANHLRVSLYGVSVVHAEFPGHQRGDFPARLLHRERVRPAAAERVFLTGWRDSWHFSVGRNWTGRQMAALPEERKARRREISGLRDWQWGRAVASFVCAVRDASGERHPGDPGFSFDGDACGGRAASAAGISADAPCRQDRALLLAKSESSIENLQRLQAQMVQSEKLISLGQLAAGAAHEINNPLTAILGYSDLLADDPCPARPRTNNRGKDS